MLLNSSSSILSYHQYHQYHHNYDNYHNHHNHRHRRHHYHHHYYHYYSGEFESIFGNIGTVTLSVDAKTGAAKTSKILTSKSLTKNDVDNAFGSMLQNLTTETFNKPHKVVDLDVRSASLTYSTNTQNIKIKFVCKSP